MTDLKPAETYNYVVSASKETVIDHCVSGSFTTPDSCDVICAKGTRIEVRTLVDGEEKLVLVCTQPMYGRVSLLRLFRAPSNPNSTKEWLFVLTERLNFFIFSYESGPPQLVERGFGNLSEVLSKPVQVPFVVVDAKSRFALCHLLQGLLSVIVFDPRSGGVKETFVTSLEELTVLDMAFVSQRQLLCVLHEDNRFHRHVKTYEVNAKNLREMTLGPWSQPHVESTAHRLLPALGGLLLFSSASVVHLRGDETVAPTTTATTTSSATTTTTTTTTLATFFGKVEAVGLVDRDGSRVLLGDESGSLHILVLTDTGGTTIQMSLDFLGEVSVPTCVCYLDAGLVFVASRLSDSQLVRLHPDGLSALELVERFANLGPIVHACLMDLDKKGQLVTCSGGLKDGSLRVVRNGVGVDEQCAIDLPGIKGMWPLSNDGSTEHAFLVLAFTMETRLLGFAHNGSTEEEEEDAVLSEVEMPGFLLDATTLFCGNVAASGLIIQVCPTLVRLLSPTGTIPPKDWALPEARRVTLASTFNDSSLLLLALTGGTLVVLNVGGDAGDLFGEKLRVNLPHDIASVCAAGRFLVVSLWTDLTIRVLSLDNGTELCCVSALEEHAATSALARSLVLVRFTSSSLLQLLVGFGDGRLASYVVDGESGKLVARRTMTLGSQPVDLTTFRDASSLTTYVFCACDRPTIVYAAPHAENKLLLSNVNIPLPELTRMCPFNSASFPNCLALASEERLVLGMVNDVQNIHVRTIPLQGERPGRIAHQQSTSTFALCVHNVAAPAAAVMVTADDEEPAAAVEICYLRLLDDRSFRTLDSYKFDETELPFCILSLSFGAAASYFVVGTVYANEEDREPTRGRIIMFEVANLGDERRLVLVTEKMLKGGVYDLCQLPNSNRLVAGVNAKVHVFCWNPPGGGAGGEMLVQDASFHGHTLCLFLRCFGEGNIVVGDLVKNVTLLSYDRRKSTIREVARALPPSWLTGLELLDESSFLSSDTEGNLTVLRASAPTSPSDETEDATAITTTTLVSVGEFFWGDFINVFVRGSLVGAPEEQNIAPRLLFGTASGAIGVLCALSAKEFAQLDRLQHAMNEVVRSVGGQKPLEWRIPVCRTRGGGVGKQQQSSASAPRGFVDGDLVETLLEMTEAEVLRVCERMNQGLAQQGSGNNVKTEDPARMRPEELLRLVEDLTRLH